MQRHRKWVSLQQAGSMPAACPCRRRSRWGINHQAAHQQPLAEPCRLPTFMTGTLPAGLTSSSHCGLLSKSMRVVE